MNENKKVPSDKDTLITENCELEEEMLDEISGGYLPQYNYDLRNYLPFQVPTYS